jgi:ribosomal protein S3AE
MAKTREYSDLLVRAKNVHSEDESIHIRLKALAWAIEDIQRSRTKLIRKCLRELKALNDLQKWLADQLEEDLLAIEKEENG